MEISTAAKFKGRIIETSDEVTLAVLEAMAQAGSARLREIAASFVRHLHAFAREVGLTETEYEIGIDFLNRIGKATHDYHNEGMLFGDAILRRRALNYSRSARSWTSQESPSTVSRSTSGNPLRSASTKIRTTRRPT